MCPVKSEVPSTLLGICKSQAGGTCLFVTGTLSALVSLLVAL